MRFMFKKVPIVFILLSIIGVAFLLKGRMAYSDVDCLMCHEKISKEKVVHPALQMGCPTCHTAIDAKDIPHKKTNNIAKGLSSEQPDLCFNCHDKTRFSKKTVHPALGMACTACHNPHSSKNAKLLNSEPPDLCYNCHDRKKFEGKTVHPPVSGGMCTTCHNPHSTDTPRLLASEPPELCFNCHDKVEFTKKNVHPPVAGGMCLTCHAPHASKYTTLTVKAVTGICITCHTEESIRSGLHVVRGFRSVGHPVSGKEDPKRSGKRFSCASCHNPHSSDYNKLFRYKAQIPFELCINCHEK